MGGFINTVYMLNSVAVLCGVCAVGGWFQQPHLARVESGAG